MAETAVVTVMQVRAFRARVAEQPLPAEPADLVELIAELEALKASACARQAEAAVEVDRARRAERAERGVPAARRGQGVASEIALARRESPHRGQQLLAFAKTLRSELAHTAARFHDGELSEWRAILVARETACLDVGDRRAIDEEVCGDAARLDGLGTQALVAMLRKAAAQRDPGAVVERARRAESERRVSVRPAPDAMCYLTALVPTVQGVAAYASLTKDAEHLHNIEGDPRGKGQLMADLLHARLTGTELPAAEVEASGEISVSPPAVPLTVNMTISDVALLGGGREAATITARGVPAQIIPAEIARRLVSETLNAGTLSAETKAWIRLLYADPAGRLVAMTSKSRYFPAGLADFLALRDQGICRTPYCDAPVRHIDHVTAAADGGRTQADSGQGLCEACNHAKQGAGWQQHVDPAAQRHAVATRTPTGHTFTSTAPPPPGVARGDPLERSHRAA
ncbi:DUF222 domain-containing protein [Georgenia halophila]|uniref:DUF222 domain-containing protein n=1 Tax=Georgenia halophila TaxID=620889 RepID=A0ABP8L6Q7_9MICO